MIESNKGAMVLGVLITLCVSALAILLWAIYFG